jgi:rfaE bifunctional protein kinase chain/domain/rfaE bifunctional protein nucleotidyltransferase chain/domain
MKIITLEELAEKILILKSEGKKIVLCHGCFDLMHIGHIKYFQAAKSMGDILIVTVTPNIYVDKGPGRPIFNQELRAQSIAALECVDYVAINKWPTAEETLRLLQPDIYVKGQEFEKLEDKTGKIQKEFEVIKEIGAKLCFTHDITFSSSNLINQNFSSLNGAQKEFLEKLKEKYIIEEITEYIENLKKLKVLLIGEVIIDEYVFCNPIGKSGKDPILVNHKIYTEKYAGGVLAVANHLSNFCQEAKILTYLGEIDNHEQFVKENLKDNIYIDYVVKSNAPTIRKTRFVDDYTKIKTLGVYDINNEFLNETEELDLCLKIGDCIANYDIVIVVDYGHGLLTQKIVKLIEEKAKFLAVNTQLNAFNTSYHTITKYKNVNYICVQEGELRHEYRNPTATVKDLTSNLFGQVKPDAIVITQGKKGSLSFKDNKFTVCPAFATKVVDRTGAGDALLSITSLCFAADIPTDLTLFIGNLVAAEKVALIGTGFKLDKEKLLKTIVSLLK